MEKTNKQTKENLPFRPALHGAPGSLVTPPRCPPRAQPSPKPGSPAEPGYPLLSPLLEYLPIAAGAPRLGTWGYESNLPFRPALHRAPGSLVTPPRCPPRAQPSPKPGSPAEPGYPLLSPTPPGIFTNSRGRTEAGDPGVRIQFVAKHFGRFAGLPTPNRGTLRGQQSARWNQSKA